MTTAVATQSPPHIASERLMKKNRITLPVYGPESDGNAASGDLAFGAPGGAAQPQSPTGHAQPLLSLELQRLRSTLRKMVEAASTLRTAQEQLVQAEALVGSHEGDLAVRFLMLQLRELAGLRGLAEQWENLLRDDPDDLATIRFTARSLVKEQRPEEALRLIDRLMPEDLGDARVALARAELLGDIQAYEASDALFRRVIAVHDRREARVSFAKRLRKRGLIADAVHVLDPVARSLQPGTKAAQLATELADEYAFFRALESEEGLAGQDIKLIAMKHAILHYRDRKAEPALPGRPGRLALVTGNLGAGGAERQLSRLGLHLHRLSEKGTETVSGAALPDMVEVIVKQHGGGQDTDAGRQDFFLAELLSAGVPVREINKLPAISAGNQRLGDTNFLRLLSHLPAQVHYGITRLCPYLRERSFDVVSLWQDGACLFGALAALVAGAPVIHLVFRGLPPNIRQERFRPEYAVLYRALAEIPGVLFLSNSKAAAKEYARWLGLPLKRFHILYNGVPRIEASTSAADERKWQDFAERTAGATETIGGVFRFETAKRPLLWLRLAYRYLKRRPHARFVIVGHGRLHAQALALAAELHIADRILFVGHSEHVGFWYSKMDVKVLLSRFEGLPNALIEAQLMGVRIVSTPAGGAGECFIDGDTGHLLASAESPDLIEACEKIAMLVDSARISGRMTACSISRASTLFSLDAVIATFSRLCLSPDPAGAEASSRVKVAA